MKDDDWVLRASIFSSGAWYRSKHEFASGGFTFLRDELLLFRTSGYIWYDNSYAFEFTSEIDGASKAWSLHDNEPLDTWRQHFESVDPQARKESSLMKARLGIAPIAWTNDDLPQLGGDTPLEVCLSESREAGFSGTETGGKFPKTPRELKEVLAAHDLKLVSGWYSGRVLENDLAAEKDRAHAQLQLFRENNAAVLVYGETTGTVQNQQQVPLAKRPRLDDEQMRTYGRKLTAFAEHCHGEKVPLSFHHHMATAIETEDDVNRLMNFSGEAVGLLFDTGHITFAGGDGLRMAKRHGKRINHVHTKDIRKSVLQSIDAQKTSFLDAVLAGVFTVPGDGMIDFKAVAKLCAEIGYEGWFVVEAEQDPKKANPLKYARIGYEALSEALDQAGYTIEQ